MAGVRRRVALAGTRKAAGHTQESLAEALHVDRTTVIRWEAGDQAPLPYLRLKLARLLNQSPEQLRELIENDSDIQSSQDGTDPDVEAAFDWLDRRAGWSPGTSRRKVMSRPGSRDRDGQRVRLARGDVAQALWNYYGDPGIEGCGAYRARVGGRDVLTSIVTRPEWLDLACPLTPVHDRLMLAAGSPASWPVEVDDFAAKYALRRLREVVALGVRLTNAPIYRLLNLDIQPGTIGGEVGLARFVEYALTMDLLEGELLDAIVSDGVPRAASLPLRDRYLPDLGSVLEMSGRLCAGGVVALSAIARPADTYRGAADYVLLTRHLARFADGVAAFVAQMLRQRVGLLLLRGEPGLVARDDGANPARSSSGLAVPRAVMSSSAVLISSAVVCGVWQVGSHVV